MPARRPREARIPRTQCQAQNVRSKHQCENLAPFRHRIGARYAYLCQFHVALILNGKTVQLFTEKRE